MATVWPELLDDLARYPRLDHHQRSLLLESVRTASSPDIDDLLELLDAIQTACSDPLSEQDEEVGSALEVLFSTIMPQFEKLRGQIDRQSDQWQQQLRKQEQRLTDLYLQLEDHNPFRGHLLRVMAALGTESALTILAEVLAEDPPQDSRHADLVFAALWRNPQLKPEPLFPKLLDALQHENVASLVLELANHFYRQGLAEQHPALPRAGELTKLFGYLVNHLGMLEERPGDFVSSVEDLSRIVQRSVGLATAIADALGLMKYEEANGKLRQAFTLSHRRLQAEAASAVARLGDEAGVKQLASLTADPGIRLRALAYLEELGKLQEVAEEYRSPAARAEAELSAFLAQNSQFGLAPSEMELLDNRELRWPGFDEPVNCFLIRFRYRHPRGTLEGVGLVGPLTYSLKVPVEGLEPADIYAMYCGWYVEHPEVRRISVNAFTSLHQAQLAQVTQMMEQRGYDSIRAVECVQFFESYFWIFQADRWDADEARPGVAVVEGEEIEWFAQKEDHLSIGPNEAYYLHAGRKVLETFNSPDALK